MEPMLTPRLELPLLATGQAQKEMFHNEALSLLDFLIQPVVESIEAGPENLTPSLGAAWLVESSPTGEWAGHANYLAGWTSGGWRFIKPIEYMRIFVIDIQQSVTFSNGSWQLPDIIASPGGGTVIDTESRAAIESILSILQTAGLIAN